MATIRNARPIYPTAAQEPTLSLDQMGQAPLEPLPDISPKPIPPPSKPSGGGGGGMIFALVSVVAVVGIGIAVVASKSKKR